MEGRTHPSDCSGFTLIEVLVTVVILSLGLLGLAALHAASMRGTQGAYLRSQAASLGYQIADAMRANREAARDQDYDTSYDDNAASLGCAGSSSVAESDLCLWKDAIEARLPAGAGSVSVDTGSDVATVCVRWSEPDRAEDVVAGSDNCGTPAAGDRVFELQTVL